MEVTQVGRIPGYIYTKMLTLIFMKEPLYTREL